ncbi:MAG: sugar porter family MFS transporter [Acidobacteriota bacterium]|nr:sugar porter family MFS transporter [Acidobacteriota bacterium]
MLTSRLSPAAYGRFLVGIAGFGGLLYGIDIGVIAAALLYLSKTVNLTVAQTSAIVAAVLGGSMVSSLIAGLLADWVGRKKIMIVSGVMFLASVVLIVLSQGFATLLFGRLLQGMSGGVIAVVVPLYLAECLGAHHRGRGTAIFQWMLTFGIVIASVTGLLYTRAAEAAITAAAGNPVLIQAAESHAWRGMFLATMYPGLIFFLGTLFLVESPRWLFRKGRNADALASLHKLLPPDEAVLQMREMEALAVESSQKRVQSAGDSLLQRKYVVPFLLACIVLACNQATGINSILGFLVVILKQAGMSSAHATQGDLVVKIVHCAMTVIAVLLVDRKGRRFLLRIGTGGLVCSLIGSALLFHTFEAQRLDVKQKVQTAIGGNALHLPVDTGSFGPNVSGRRMALTVLYSYGHGDRVATVLDTDQDHVLSIAPDRTETGAPLVIRRAFYGPVASETTGWLITIFLGLFVSFFSLGPGVVVWLMLSELMPTRIRSTGMGIALLINQGVSTAIAAVFLPVVGNYGFYAMFLFWAGCTTIYFITATFFLPETKERTLEEIEEYFEHPRQKKFA